MKETLMKGEIEMVIIKFEDFNTPLVVTERTSRQINKDIEELKNAINQLDLIDIYKTFLQQ